MKKRNWFAALLGTVAIVGGLLTTATANASTKPHSPPSGGSTLTISDAQFLWTCGFSPFTPTSNFLSLGVVYEPLMFVNTLQNARVTPFLATSYAWRDGNKVLTFTIRNGVNWTDGKPFTPADVVFTFNMLKKYSALDLNAIWSVLSSVTQKGSNQVVMTFKRAAVPYFYYIADQVGIVPQHVWSTVGNPVAYKDKTPVGTGPYEVQSCTPQNVSYVKNQHYWQPGLPKVAKVEYPAFASNPPANTLLSTGGAQWGGQFIPNLRGEYLSKSPSNHFWFPPVVNVSIFINQKDPLLANLAVRKAIAYAVDRSQVGAVGEYGYEPAANQAGIIVPTFKSWLDQSELNSAGYKYDPKMAISILEKAGFKRGGNGTFVSPSGKPLSFTIINQSAYTDWVADLQVVAHELAAVGISLTVENLAGTDYSAKLYDGNFQLAYGYETGGPSPYYEFNQWLNSANTAPVGKPAATNWERYSNTSTDSLLAQYTASTSSSVQHSVLDKLQNVLLKDVPLIPVIEQVDWDEYSTAHFSGWPSASDPYAQPYVYVSPDWEVVLLHLSVK
ncbi:MAG: ABC transporter substrate-binding protein [Acidimicrobiales bacterium]